MAQFINGKWVYDGTEKFDVMTGKPLGQVAGDSTGDPLQYGAGGAGEFPENDAVTEEATGFGVPRSEVGNYQSDPGYRIPAPVYLDRAGSAGVASEYGLTGISRPGEYAGMTRAQAQAKAKAKQDQLKASTSANTSYSYNPQTISGVNNKVKELKIQLDSLNASPWNNSSQKKENGQLILNGYANQLAGLFSSQEDFKSALNNPDLQGAFQKFQALGGNPADISSKISEAPAGNQGVPSPYQDGSQTTDEYLGNLIGGNKIDTPEAKKALADLIPEAELTQAQIMQSASIPEKFKDLYFGTPEKVGLLQEKIDLEKEKVDLLTRKAELDKANANAQVQYNIEKNNADVAIEQATIEQNRLAAKNYMTGALAKLGALNTTGAAPLALANLEQKYQQQSQTLNTKLQFANRQLNIDLNEKVSGIDYKRDDDILSLKNDLSKSREDVLKEGFKLQNAADKEKFRLISKFQDEFTKRKDAYSKEAKKLAEDNLKEQKRLLEKYDSSRFLKEFGGGVVDNRKKKGSGLSNDGYNKSQLKELADAGLSDIAPRDKSYFFTLEAAARKWIGRQALTGKQFPTLEEAYAQWKKSKKTDDGGKSDDEIVNDFING